MFPTEPDRLPDLLPALICVLANAFFVRARCKFWGTMRFMLFVAEKATMCAENFF